MDDVEKVLIPLGGQRDHSRTRVRLLASLARSRGRSIRYLSTLLPSASPETRRRFEREIHRMVRDEAGGPYDVVVETAAFPEDAIIRHAATSDLVVMGMRTEPNGKRSLRGIPHTVAVGSKTPLILIGRRPKSVLVRTGQDLLAAPRRGGPRRNRPGGADPQPPGS